MGSKDHHHELAVNGSYVDIVGFDGTSTGQFGYALGTNATNNDQASVHILNNYFHDFNTSNCERYGVINDIPHNGHTSNGTWIIGNVIRHAGNYNFPGPPGEGCSGLHGMYIDSNRVVIENNIVSGITGWGLQRVTLPGNGGPDVISNNIFFNNGGGILITENNGTQGPAWDHSTLSNNIVVNNGVGVPSGVKSGKWGISYYHVTGKNNNVTNNMIYGNVNQGVPADLGHHYGTCTHPSPITGTYGDGDAGGCPSSNPFTDANTTATFVNFQSDTNLSPASNYNPANYQLKSGSNAINQGSASCATSPGIFPCTPTTDFSGISRPQGAAIDIGAYEQ